MRCGGRPGGGPILQGQVEVHDDELAATKDAIADSLESVVLCDPTDV